MKVYEVYAKRRLIYPTVTTWWVSPTWWANRDYGLVREFGPYSHRRALLVARWKNLTFRGKRKVAARG